jgi:RND family efflux transporter MFP subunit
VKAQIGDHVKAGELLASLDARDLDTAVRRATAACDEVREAMLEADSSIAASNASLELAQATFARMQDLYNKKSLSTQEFDETQANLKSAQAAHEMTLARRRELDSKLRQADQEVSAAEVNRSYAEIAAPFAGLVTSKSVESGNLAMPGSPLFTIEREGPFRLEAAVEDSRLGSIRLGQPVSAHLDVVDRPVDARVSEIVPGVDALSRSGTVKIDLPPLGGLRSGGFGRAVFTLGKRKLIAVPAGAVATNGQLESVYVSENGLARARLVTLGQRLDDSVEVLSGLNEGEEVIFPVPRTLSDGVRVEARP